MEDGGGQVPHLDCAMVTWWYRTPPPSPPLPLEQGLHHLVLAPPTLQRQHISHTSIPGNHGLHPRLPCSNRPQTLLWKPTTRLGVRHIDHPGSIQLAPRVSDGGGAAYTGGNKRGGRVVTGEAWCGFWLEGTAGTSHPLLTRPLCLCISPDYYGRAHIPGGLAADPLQWEGVRVKKGGQSWGRIPSAVKTYFYPLLSS